MDTYATPKPVKKKKRKLSTDDNPCMLEARLERSEKFLKYAGNSNSKISMWAVQCNDCFKWRSIPTEEEFEEIRRKVIEDPFTCSKLPNISCDTEQIIEPDTKRTWVIDRPNVPKTPPGFKRTLVLRKDCSRMDCYYTTPNGIRLRCITEVPLFLQKHPEYNVTPEDFSFTTPKVMKETVPQDLLLDKKKANSSGRIECN